LIVLLAGGVLTGLGVKALVDSQRFLATAASADGVVVFVRTEIRWECHGQGSNERCGDHTYPHPTVRFVTAHEQVVEFEGDDGSLQLGDSAKVLYDPANPHNARLDSWPSRWGAAVVLGSVGLGLFAIAGTGLAVRHRHHRRQVHRT
jgi:hypothetical protein